MKQLLILLTLLLCAATAAGAMTIEEDTACVDDEMVVDDHITIKAGARLLLEDCILTFDDGETEEEGQWFTSGNLEGLLLHVEEDATLELRSVDGPAGMRAAGGDYAYSLRVDGSLVMKGTPEHPVEVSGLEGYFLEASTLGGIEVFGSATMDHVDFIRNQGPSLLIRGGSAEVSDTTVRRNTGAFAVRSGGSLDLTNVDVNVGNIGILASDSRLDMHNVTLFVQNVAIKAVRSDITVLDSTVDSVLRGSAELTDTNLTVERSLLRFAPGGIIHGHNDDYPGTNRIVVRDSILEGRDRRESMAITAANVDLDVERTTLRNFTYFGINHGGGTARLVDNFFDGSGKYHAYLSGEPDFEVRGNVGRGEVQQGIVYAATIFFDVVDAGGPVANATIQLPTGENVTTNDRGSFGMVLTVALDGQGEPVEPNVPFLVRSEGRVQEVAYALGDETRLRVDFDAREGGTPRGIPGPGVVVALAAIAVGVVLRRR